MSAVELLTTNEDGDPIQGMLFPEELGTVQYVPEGESLDDRKLAYRFTFYLRNNHGIPRAETITSFYVPEHLLRNMQPTPWAVELAGMRIRARMEEKK